MERALRDSHAVDLEALCVIAGRKVAPLDQTEIRLALCCNSRSRRTLTRMLAVFCDTCRACEHSILCCSCLEMQRSCGPSRGCGRVIMQVWFVRVDIHVLDADGNLADAAVLSALAALLSFRRPDVTVGGADGWWVAQRAVLVRIPIACFGRAECKR